MRRLSKCCLSHYNCNLQDVHYHVGYGCPPLPTFFYQAITFFSFTIALEITNCNTHKTCNGVGVVGMINIIKKNRLFVCLQFLSYQKG